MASLTVVGKGVYAWQPWGLGTPEQVAQMLVDAGVSHVCFKGHNGYALYPSAKPYSDAAKARRIKVGIYGYIYLKYNWAAERDCAVSAIDYYQPDYYIIDGESECKGYYSQATNFSAGLKSRKPLMPIGLASFRFPSYHPTFPWRQFRAHVDFDAPQMYYRYSEPVSQLTRSKRELANMAPALPYAMPAGDMYLEHSYKPTRAQVRAYLTAVRDDPNIQSTLMWSMDQKVAGKAPELWEEFATFQWDTTPPDPDPDPLPQCVTPCAGAVWSTGLSVRSGPGTNYPVLRYLSYGDIVGLYGIERNWGEIAKNGGEWVHTNYLTNAELEASKETVFDKALRLLRRA